MISRRRFCAAVVVMTVTAIFARAIIAQSLDGVLENLIEDQIEQQVEATVVDSLERRVTTEIEKGLEVDLAEALDGVPRAAVDPLRDVREIVPEAARDFVTSLDDQGNRIERGVWVLLVTPAQLERVEDLGLAIDERRRLEGLGLVLLRIQASENTRAGGALLRHALDTPGVEVDRNHLYHPDAPTSPETTTRPRRQIRAPATEIGGGLTLAIVDSAVTATHEALRRATIVQGDFVSVDRPRPTDHGTAVASLLVGDSATLRGSVPGARLLAASVFFEEDDGGSVATTSSLIRGLDWAASHGATVVNMSLSGPPNRVLATAIEQVADRGVVVVAAVGNDGPAGRPLYPAAYRSAVGVTAIDTADRVYRYANRGSHVMFAALGVNLVVAESDGGYRLESGTSMAAPRAAAIIARALAESKQPASRVLSRLRAAALDLGDPGFDETFGFGKIGMAE